MTVASDCRLSDCCVLWPLLGGCIWLRVPVGVAVGCLVLVVVVIQVGYTCFAVQFLWTSASGLSLVHARSCAVQQLCAAVGFQTKEDNHILKTLEQLFQHLLGVACARY